MYNSQMVREEDKTNAQRTGQAFVVHGEQHAPSSNTQAYLYQKQ